MRRTTAAGAYGSSAARSRHERRLSTRSRRGLGPSANPPAARFRLSCLAEPSHELAALEAGERVHDLAHELDRITVTVDALGEHDLGACGLERPLGQQRINVSRASRLNVEQMRTRARPCSTASSAAVSPGRSSSGVVPETPRSAYSATSSSPARCA